jgi:hypothetical protein
MARTLRSGTGKNQGWKKPGFLKKNQPSGFFLGFFGFSGFLNIFAEKKEFLGFFQFQEYF